MPLTTLLGPHGAKLSRLSLHRIQLDRQEPLAELKSVREEVLLYPLVGSLRVEIEGTPGTETVLLDGRRSVFEPGVQPVRCTSGQPWMIRLGLRGYAADVLVVTAMPHPTDPGLIGVAPVVCHGADEVDTHDVGVDAHRREVRVVQTPPGGLIHAGETLNPPGHWSSWPSHSTPAERARHAEHEEVFFIVTGGFGMIQLDGTYGDGTVVDSWMEVRNGASLVTPLGNHPIVADPAHRLYYAWFYLSFLEKTYNRYATDSVQVYVK